jgi:predicted nucleotidyltransferase
VAIFSTVVAACRDYLRRYKPPVVTFETPDAKKRNLYVRMTGMFPDYVVYPYLQWVHDPIVGDEIVDSLMDGNANDAVVLRRRDYDPEKTRVYIDEQGPSNDTAISLSKLGKFHPGADTLAEFVPERATAQYALHPDKWESTFYSLTNKDSDKLKYYGPKKISIPPGTLVGDMAIANKFYRAKTSEEKQQYAELYRQSLKPYPVDVSAYRMPELLIPRQGMAEDAMRGVIYTKPNLEHEWPEANRYPEFHKLGKDQWIKIARQGSMAKWSSLKDVGNVDSDLSNLEPEKRKRAAAMVNRGKVELPIVGRWSNGDLDLIAGNTRLATLLDQGHDPKVWVVDVPGKQGVAEGKHPNQQVVNAIQKVLPVAQEIWFHGSRATGQHRRNSDTDILVVVPDDLVGDQYLGVVRILQKLSSHFDNYDIQPTKSGTNIHQIAQEEGKLLWSTTNENFADGKVKGKSRPGRVKRSGASCNGSVTDLRQRAKNASGERAKMYHWCANMKSGKKK